MGVQNLGPCSDFQLKPQQIGPASRGASFSGPWQSCRGKSGLHKYCKMELKQSRPEKCLK